MQVLKKDSRDLSTYRLLIENTQGILNSLQRWQINHVCRNLNGAAHQLGRALYLCEEQCLFEEILHVFRILLRLSAVLKWLMYEMSSILIILK